MQIIPKRILWPTDFSDLAMLGGRHALGYRRQFGAELHVIHVIPPPITPDVSLVVPAEAPLAVSDPETVEASESALGKLAAELFPDEGDVITRVLFGAPWPAICDYARENDIDLIVVTTHGRTGLSHMLIGSTAERIVQHAPCAVLTIKQTQEES